MGLKLGFEPIRLKKKKVKRKNPAKKISTVLGQLELEIMKVIWELGSASVSEVTDKLKSHREDHHNKGMTKMVRLVQKGFLSRSARDGRTPGYQACFTNEEISEAYLDLVRDPFFKGSTTLALARGKLA